MKAGMVTHPHKIIFELARDFNTSQKKFTGSLIHELSSREMISRQGWMVTHHPHKIIFEVARDFNASQKKFTGPLIL